MRIVIIGSGLAGQLVLQNLRKEGFSGEILMLSQHSGDFYLKPLLSGVFSQNKQPKDLVQFTEAEISEKYQCEMVSSVTVERIDRENKQVITDTGAYQYDQLVLAIGATPIDFAWIPKADNVFRVNHLEDYKRFYKNIRSDKKTAIIGGGLIGVEFAYDLAKHCSVTIFERSPILMASMLPQEVGQYLKTALEEKGVEVFTNVSVDSVSVEEKIIMQWGEKTEHYDNVLVAVGIQPNTTLAKDAELAVSRGIQVDQYGRTSDENIYALGDCAEVCGLVKCFVAPLRACAAAIAKNMVGQVTPIVYEPMIVQLKTPDIPISLCYARYSTNWEVSTEAHGISALSYEGDKLKGFVLAGDCVAKRTELKKQMDNWI